MTIKAGSTVVNISVFLFVFIIHIGFVMFMAIDAGKYFIVARVGMALGTIIPFSLVFS